LTDVQWMRMFVVACDIDVDTQHHCEMHNVL
jgi:hypothetical protein